MVRVETITKACATIPPPEKPGELISECEGWEGCITFENMGKLAQYLMQVDTWMKDNWAACRQH